MKDGTVNDRKREMKEKLKKLKDILREKEDNKKQHG